MTHAEIKRRIQNGELTELVRQSAMMTIDMNLWLEQSPPVAMDKIFDVLYESFSVKRLEETIEELTKGNADDILTACMLTGTELQNERSNNKNDKNRLHSPYTIDAKHFYDLLAKTCKEREEELKNIDFGDKTYMHSTEFLLSCIRQCAQSEGS